MTILLASLALIYVAGIVGDLAAMRADARSTARISAALATARTRRGR